MFEAAANDSENCSLQRRLHSFLCWRRSYKRARIFVQMLCHIGIIYAHHSLWSSDWNGNCEHWKLIAEFKLSLKISATHTINKQFSGKFAWKSHNLSVNLRFSDFCFLHFYISLVESLRYKKNPLNTRMAVRIHDDLLSCLLDLDFSSLGPRLYGPAKSRAEALLVQPCRLKRAFIWEVWPLGLSQQRSHML